MCACRRGIREHLRDGKIRYIDGNSDDPVNKDVLCAKGSAGEQYRPAGREEALAGDDDPDVGEPISG